MTVVRTIVYCDEIEARQMADDVVLVPTNFKGEASRHELEVTAERTRQRFAESFRVDLDDIQVIDVQIGRRAMPHDGMPLIGRIAQLSGVYLTVMHSGVTLAPAAARLAAAELIDGADAGELCSLRPDRFS